MFAQKTRKSETFHARGRWRLKANVVELWRLAN